MQLPNPEILRAILAAARENGVTRLKLGALEVDLAPVVAPSILEAINKSLPLPPDEDPIAIIKGTVRPTANAEPQDILEAMAAGRPLTGPIGHPNPTAPQ